MTRKELRQRRRHERRSSLWWQIPGFVALVLVALGIYLTWTSQTIIQFIHTL